VKGPLCTCNEHMKGLACGAPGCPLPEPAGARVVSCPHALTEGLGEAASGGGAIWRCGACGALGFAAYAKPKGFLVPPTDPEVTRICYDEILRNYRSMDRWAIRCVLKTLEAKGFKIHVDTPEGA